MEKQDKDNFRKEILAQRFARSRTDMDIYERELYFMFTRKTVGYGQYTSELLSYTEMSNYTQLSLSTIKRIVPKLIDKNLIIRKATNQIENVGKVPYKYQLNMKLDDFPNLGKLRKNREDITQPITGSEPIFEDTSTWTLKYIIELTERQKEENFLTKKIEYDDNLVESGLDFDVATLNEYIKEEE